MSPTSVHIRYRGLQQFFRWAVEDGEVGVSPMVNMHPPIDERINLHRFRHTYAHQQMADGVEGENLMALAGWRSRSMPSRYGSSVAAEHALEDAHRRTAQGDKL